MERIKHPNLAMESYVIAGICFLDLVLTIWLVGTGRAREGNPVMSFYLDKGWTPLVAIKISLILLPIFIAEWARKYHPGFVRRMLRLTIAVYMGMYLAAFVQGGMPALIGEQTVDAYSNGAPSPTSGVTYQQYEAVLPSPPATAIMSGYSSMERSDIDFFTRRTLAPSPSERLSSSVSSLMKSSPLPPSHISPGAGQ